MLDDLLGIREAPSGLLGEDELPVQHHLEDASTGGNEVEVCDLLSVIMEYSIRQTDGLGQIASRRAVLNAHHTLASHAALSFLVAFSCVHCRLSASGLSTSPRHQPLSRGARAPFAQRRRR